MIDLPSNKNKHFQFVKRLLLLDLDHLFPSPRRFEILRWLLHTVRLCTTVLLFTGFRYFYWTLRVWDPSLTTGMTNIIWGLNLMNKSNCQKWEQALGTRSALNQSHFSNSNWKDTSKIWKLPREFFPKKFMI